MQKMFFFCSKNKHYDNSLFHRLQLLLVGSSLCYIPVDHPIDHCGRVGVVGVDVGHWHSIAHPHRYCGAAFTAYLWSPIFRMIIRMKVES